MTAGAGGNGVVTIAERDVPSGLAALLVAAVPLWVVLLRWTVLGPTDTVAAGLALTTVTRTVVDESAVVPATPIRWRAGIDS